METRAYFNNVVEPATLKKRLLDRRQKRAQFSIIMTFRNPCHSSLPLNDESYKVDVWSRTCK